MTPLYIYRLAAITLHSEDQQKFVIESIKSPIALIAECCEICNRNDV